MKLHHLPLALVLAGALTAQAGEEGAASITTDEIQSHIGHLADDALQGRGTGTPGERMAAEYIIGKLRDFGVEPGSQDGTYLQPFTLTGSPKLTATPALAIGAGPWTRVFTPEADFVPFSFSSSGTAKAQLVFAGYGVTNPQAGYDDYAGLDVKDKIVVVLRHEPREKDQRASQHSYFTTKAKNAAAHGAAGMLLVTDPANHPDDETLVPFQGGGSGEDFGLIAAHVRQDLIEGLFRLEGRDLIETQRQIDETLKPRSFAFEANAEIDVQIERTQIQARNVVAKIEGSDPTLKDEVLVIGAHYDHLGHGHSGTSLGGQDANGVIHNGADDNASGSSGLLELAQAFRLEQPRRTVYFVWFSGEELGLLGSQHFVANPPVEQQQIVAMINLDMIGRLTKNTVEVGGAGTSPNFSEMITQAAAAEGVKATLNPSGFGPSDHASFYAAKIPVLFFFTGLHDDYHKPSDDPETVNAAGASKVTRTAFACAEEIANADERPAYVEVPREGRGRGNRNRARMGVMPDQAFAGPGVRLAQVPQGPSQKAGLAAGDVVRSVGGVETNDLRGLLEALSKHKPGDEVEVVFERDGQQKTATVKLGGR
jgi:hypothetical protein